MIKCKKILSFLLVGTLILCMALSVQADEISDIKKKQQQLEQERQAAEEQKKSLDETLERVVAEMKAAKEKLLAKQVEIEQAQDELDEARIAEYDQYESMKLRIQFMYEKGNTYFMEILCQATDMADFLNKADYIRGMSEYDRNELNELRAVVAEVEEREAQLNKEEEELVALQNGLVEKQKEVQTLLAEANETIEGLEEDIAVNTDRLQALLASAKTKQSGTTNGRPATSGTAGSSQVIGNGKLAWPTASTRVTCGFGPRVAPVPGATTYHAAIDIGAPDGTPVYAADNGKVTLVSYGYNGGRGNYIMIDHGNGIKTRYQHLNNNIFVSVGQSVTRGQNIAQVGNTGASSGPHLDFAVYENGTPVDPMKFF